MDKEAKTLNSFEITNSCNCTRLTRNYHAEIPQLISLETDDYLAAC